MLDRKLVRRHSVSRNSCAEINDPEVIRHIYNLENIGFGQSLRCLNIGEWQTHRGEVKSGVHVKFPLECKVQLFRDGLECFPLLLGIHGLEESRSDKSGRYCEDRNLENTDYACNQLSDHCDRWCIGKSSRILDILVESPYHSPPAIVIYFRLLLVLYEEQKE